MTNYSILISVLFFIKLLCFFLFLFFWVVWVFPKELFWHNKFDKSQVNKMSSINKANDWKEKKINFFSNSKMSLVKFLAYVFRLFRKQENYHVIYPKSYDDILEVSHQHFDEVKMSVYFFLFLYPNPLFGASSEGPCVIRITGKDP